VSLATSGRLRILAGVVLALTFGAGGLGGAAAYRALHDRARERMRSASQQRQPECPGRMGEAERRQRALREYSQLGLSKQQEDQLLALFERRRTRMDSLWQLSRPHMDSLLEATRTEVRTILSADQQKELDRLRAERQRMDSLRHEEWRARCGEQGGTPPRRGGGPGMQPRIP
jgi:hypothetical protein